MKRLLLRSAWVLIVLFLFAASGCSQLRLPAWRYPGYDVNRTNVFPATWNPAWRLQRLSKTALPSSMAVHPTLFLGDVLGGSGSEIVLVGDRRVLIYNVRGKELRSIRLQGYDHLPGFLYDADHDGKLDIVLGSRNASRPTLSIVDGAGRTIEESHVSDPGQNFRRFAPWFNVDGAFFIVASESWPLAPRGIVRFSLSEQKEQWYFAVPSDPIGLHLLKGANGQPELLLSEFAVSQGSYPLLGRDLVNSYGYDSELHLLKIGLDGRILLKHTLNLTGGAELPGKGSFLLLGNRPDAPLLLKQGFGPSSDMNVYSHTPVSEKRTSLHIVDPQTGEISFTREFGSTPVVGLRVLPAGPAIDSRIAVLLHTGDGFRLELLDSDLRLLRSRAIQAVSASLGTVVSPKSGSPGSIQSATRFFVLADNRLLLFDEGLNSEQLLTSDSGAKEMLVSIAPQSSGGSSRLEGRVVLVGKNLEVYSLRSR